MTRAQREIYSLFLKLNKEAKEQHLTHLRDGTDLKPFVEFLDNKAIHSAINELNTTLKDVTEAEKREADAQGESEFEDLLFLSYTYMCTDTEKSREAWRLYRELVYALIRERPFLQIAQNPVTNALSFLFEKDLKKDLEGNATAEVDGVLYTINNYIPAEWNTKVMMIATYLLEDLAATHRQTTSLPLSEYAEKRGIISKDLKDFRKETVKALDTLAAVTDLRYKERKNGKWEYSGGKALNGGTHTIERGYIRWNWNTDFFPSLEYLAPLDLPREAYTSDPRTNQWQVIVYIAQNYRRNEGRHNVSNIPVRTLLEKMPAIPKIEAVRGQRQSAKSKIIRPFFRDLDFFQSFTYDVIDKDGNIVINPDLTLDYDAFISCSICVDYTDWPVHESRIEHRVKREQAVIEGKKKRKQKAAEEAAQADKEKTE